MADLGLEASDLTDQEQAALLSGNQIADGAEPIATAYAGHQFGHFTLLGDGRAHLLGEHITPEGKHFDIQFKGSGRTPYARRGDGKAALGPMLREYMISEAMFALGIPTTRSLAVVTTGETIMREAPLKGAVLTRVASSHIRVGTFEFAAYQEDDAILQKLLDYTIERHYPDRKNAKNKALSLLAAVIERQTDLITHWMRVGFIHGVMNTDNMTLSGETIDYGPCAFMDVYNFKTVFSSIDRSGRYAYGNQSFIGAWNIARFAETLLPLIDPDMGKAIKMAEEMVKHFQALFEEKWLKMMCAKFGLFECHKADKSLISDMLTWMQDNFVDFTNFFRDLAHEDSLKQDTYKDKIFQDLYQRWQNRLSQEQSKSKEDAIALMTRTNPVIIPRNHHVEHVIEAANKSDLKPLHDFLSALENPYQDDERLKPYQSPPKPSERVFQTFCGT